MDAMTLVITISGWIASMISVGYIVVLELRERRQRAEHGELTAALARFSGSPPLSADDGVHSAHHVPAPDQRMRKSIVAAAAARRSVATLISELDGEYSQAQIQRSVQDLAASGLLVVEEPVSPASTLVLRT